VSKTRAYLVFLLLATACFSVATVLQPHLGGGRNGGDSASVLALMLGDGRRLFANQLFVEADIAFHSGYYPSIFDQQEAPKDSRHMTAAEGTPAEEEHEKQMNFLKPPRDWVEAFGRHFMITAHTHLEQGQEREVLPWLRLSADFDPHRIDTYTVAAYWLRSRLGKVKEAEEFLREGLRVNPDSYEILFELGWLYRQNYHDPERARNVWQLALRRWQEREAKKKEPDLFVLEEIAVHLARLEEETGHLDQAIRYLELARKVSPKPAGLQRQIDELRRKLAAPPSSPSRPPG
jgi:tetratricopeptide (TPR) repeat protein